MRLVTLNGVRYHLDCSQDYFHSVVPAITADIQNMNSTQTGEQKWFNREDRWKISNRFGVIDVEVINPVIKKKEKLNLKDSIKRYRIVLAAEYTDGTKGEYANWAWENYIGSGLLVFTIVNGSIVDEITLPWTESVALLGPWTTDSSGGDLYYRFFNYAQGGQDRYIVKDNTDFVELPEIEYDANYKFVLKSTVEETHDGYFFFEYPSPEILHTAFGKITERTTWIELNGEVVVGPLVETTTRKVEVWQKPSVPAWGYGEETIHVTGSQIMEVQGVARDLDNYLCIYNVNAAGGEIDLDDMPADGGPPFSDYSWEPKPTSGYYMFRRDSSLTGSYEFSESFSYYGTVSESMNISCATGSFMSAERIFAYTETLDYDSYSGRCVRIFLLGDMPIYVYSFYCPVLVDYDTGDYIETPACGYGMLFNEENLVTTELYERIIEADGYYYDLNIIPGLPDDFFSSILVRALLEEVSTTSERELE